MKQSPEVAIVAPRHEAETLSKLWHPKILGQVNDQYVKVARIKGEFTWHSHAEEDELFYVLKGSMRMDFQRDSVHLHEGEFLIVPRGTIHRPVAEAECLILLVETVTTQHTGDRIMEMTVSVADQL